MPTGKLQHRTLEEDEKLILKKNADNFEPKKKKQVVMGFGLQPKHISPKIIGIRLTVTDFLTDYNWYTITDYNWQ